jgi:type I restriction enzyme S subunit
VGKIVSGLTYSPDDINDDGILVLRSSNVKKRLINLNDNVFVSVNEGKFNPVELNDILICVRNGSKRLIGKNAIIKKGHIGLAFGAFMTVYRSNYNQFLFHFFDSQHYKKEVHKNLGATINSINGGDLKKFKVPFPRKEEQTKIANFLSDLDAKIEVLSTSIENTQTFKKGLLQQMFV